MIKVPLLIPAAGSGKRMGSDRNKLLLPLLEKPILQWTIEAAIACESISSITVIGQYWDYEAFCQIKTAVLAKNPKTTISWVEGGSTRQISVSNGLRSLGQSEVVLIHDGARCLATPDLFRRCAEQLTKTDGFIAAIPVKDTIKIVQNRTVISTPARDRLWAAQTPQGFKLAQLISAHAIAETEGWEVTDDASLFEKINLPVEIVLGEETNLKITTPQDLAIAELIIRQRL
jgi:2-C-methyl-D-erythritol 4-phosphate cytidylyltransferase